jgi:hypothetical protein
MNIGLAKSIARDMGFLVTESVEQGIEASPVIVYRVDRIGPPAMLQHWRPSPFNDRLVAGPGPSLIEWVWDLLKAKNAQ